MRVALINIDSKKIPNLALMQIAGWHKSQGDETGFIHDIPNPDRVYISCVFSRNAAKARGIATMYPDAEVSLGGSGINHEWLPGPMQKVFPDYDLFPSTYSLGFTTRGCIRKCPFCIVPQKEGKLQRWQHPREFYDPRFKEMALLDNNLLADRKWFFEVSDWLMDHNLKVNITQGLDVRLLDEEIAERLKAMKWVRMIRFAFDHVADEPAVVRGVELLKAAGVNVKRMVTFFVLVGYDSTFDEDKYRVCRLKELGANAYVMRYSRSPQLNALARYANASQIYWPQDINDYNDGVLA